MVMDQVCVAFSLTQLAARAALPLTDLAVLADEEQATVARDFHQICLALGFIALAFRAGDGRAAVAREYPRPNLVPHSLGSTVSFSKVSTIATLTNVSSQSIQRLEKDLTESDALMRKLRGDLV